MQFPYTSFSDTTEATRCTLLDGRDVAIRRAQAHDAAAIQDFVRGLAPRTRYYRFFRGIRELDDAALASIVQADGTRALTLLALAGGGPKVIGLGQYVPAHEASTCEIALVVDDAWQRLGLGSLMLSQLMSRAREASLDYMEGLVLWENSAMLNLVRARGFEVGESAIDPAILRVRTPLSALARAAGH